MSLGVFCHTSRLLIAAIQWIFSCPTVYEGEELHQGQLALREEAAFTYRLFTSALTIGTLPDDSVSLSRALVDCPQPVAAPYMLELARSILLTINFMVSSVVVVAKVKFLNIHCWMRS